MVLGVPVDPDSQFVWLTPIYAISLWTGSVFVFLIGCLLVEFAWVLLLLRCPSFGVLCSDYF
jgi:hypothetical protein